MHHSWPVWTKNYEWNHQDCRTKKSSSTMTTNWLTPLLYFVLLIWPLATSYSQTSRSGSEERDYTRIRRLSPLWISIQKTARLPTFLRLSKSPNTAGPKVWISKETILKHEDEFMKKDIFNVFFYLTYRTILVVTDENHSLEIPKNSIAINITADKTTFTFFGVPAPNCVRCFDLGV